MKACLVLLSIASLVLGHSQMRCLNYVNGACQAGIRSETSSFQSQAYRYPYQSGGAACQATIGNPITSGYGTSGSTPMGQLTPGTSLNIMWYARNHAVANQNPGNITVYLSPSEPMNGASDASMSTFQTRPLCTVPFASNCGPTGDAVPCTASCQVPENLATGYYTFLWYWDWRVNDGNIYTTCADAYISGSNVVQTPPSSTATPTSTSTSASTSAQTSAQQNPQTSQPPQQPSQTTSYQPAPTSAQTSAQQNPSTTSSSCVDACLTLCGSKGVVKCDCTNGYSIVCGSGQAHDETTSSSSKLVSGVLTLFLASLYFL